jgi:hypothetical protein
MLSLAIRSQCFKAIARWNTKIAQHSRLVQKTQLSQSNILDVRWQFSAPASRPDQFCFGIDKALNQGRL